MSEEVEKRIVSLEFDGSKFDSKLKKSQKSLENFKKSLNLDKEIRSFDELEKAADVDLSPLEKSIYKVEQRFTAFQMVAFSVINRVTNKLIDMGERMVKSLTIDNVRTGWAKYEQQVTAVQTLMSNVRADIEAINEASLTVNFNDDVQKMEYIEGFYERISKFADETSAGISESMSALGKFSAQGKDLATSEKAVYGIYALTASAGRSISEGAQNAELFAKIAGRSLMAADYYSLSARGLNTPQFMELLMQVASEGVGGIEPTLKAVEGGYQDISKGATEAGSAIMDVSNKYKAAMSTFTDAASAFAGINSDIAGANGALVTLENFQSTLSSKWLRGEFVMEALNKYGEFWNELSPIIDQTGKIFDARGVLAQAVRYNEKLGKYELIPDVDEAGKELDTYEEANKYLDEAAKALVDSGVYKNVESAKEYLNAIVETGEIFKGEDPIGATKWSRALRIYAKAFDENGELIKDLDEEGNVLDSYETAYSHINEAINRLVDEGLTWEEANAYLERLGSQELKLARNAFLSLQEATKLTDAIEATKVAVSGRFSSIYQALFGDYLQARELFTDLSEWLYDIFVVPIDNIADVFKDFSKSGGYELLKDMYSSIGPAIENFIVPLENALSIVFGNFGPNTLANITIALQNFFDSIADNDSIFYTIQSVATTIFTIIKALGKALSSLWTAMAPVRAMAGTVMEVIAEIVTLISDLVTSIFSVGEATTETGEKLSVFQPVVDALLYLFGIVKQIFDGIYNYLNENGVLSKIANALSQIFFTVSDVLAAIIYGIADAIGGLAQFLTESSFIQETVAFISAAFTKISEAVKNIISATKNAFISIFNAVKGFFSKIASGDFTDVKKLGTGIFNFFKLIIGGLTQMIAAGTADGTLTTFLKVLFTSIASILKGTVKEFMELADAVLTNLYIVIATAWTRFKPLIADIINFLLSAVDFRFINTLAKAIVTLGIAIGIFGIGLRSVTSALGMFISKVSLVTGIGNMARRGLFTPLSLLAEGFEDFMFSFQKRAQARNGLAIAAVIMSFVAVIGAVIGAIYLLKDLSVGDILKGALVISAIGLLVGGMVTVMAIMMGRFGKLAEGTGVDLQEFKGNPLTSLTARGSFKQVNSGIGKVAFIILGMAAFVLAIAASVWILSFAFQQAKKSGVGSGTLLAALAIMMGFLTAIMGAMAFIVAFSNNMRETETLGGGFGNLPNGVGKGIGVTRQWEGTSMYALAFPILALAALALGIGFATAKLAQAFKVFKENGMTEGQFIAVFSIFSGVIVAIMAAMVAMVALAKQNTGSSIEAASKGLNKTLLKIGVVFALFALAIGTVVGSIWLLSQVAIEIEKVDLGSVGALSLLVMVLIAIIGAFMALSKNVQWNQIGKIAAMMGILAAMLVSVVGSIWLLSQVAMEIEKVDMSSLWKLTGVLGVIMAVILVLGVVVGILSRMGPIAIIVEAIKAAIVLFSGVLVAISASLLLGALALEHATDSIIKMGNNLEIIKNVIDYFVEVMGNITALNTMSGGGMSVALIAVATAILILASAFAVFAASAWIFGKGLSAIAKGVNDFNKTDFTGLKSITSDMLETIQKFVDMAVSFTAAMAFLQLLSGGMAAIGILEVAAAIALVVMSVTSMIGVVTNLIDVLSKLGDVDPFAKMKSKMDSLKTLLMSIVDVVMDVTAYALGKMVDTITAFAASGKVAQLGWALGEFGSQITVGTVGGTLTGLFSSKTWKNAFGKKDGTTSGSSGNSKTGVNQFGGIGGAIANFLFGSGNDYEGKYDLKNLGSDLFGDLKTDLGGIFGELSSIGDSVDTIKDRQKEGLDVSNLAPSMAAAVETFTGRGLGEDDTALLKSNLAAIGSAIESATTVEELKNQAGVLMKTTKRLAQDTTDEDLSNTYKSFVSSYDEKLRTLSNGTGGGGEGGGYVIPDNKGPIVISAGTGGKVMLDDIEVAAPKNKDEMMAAMAREDPILARELEFQKYKEEFEREMGASSVTINTTNNFNGYGETELKETILETVNSSVEQAKGALTH